MYFLMGLMIVGLAVLAGGQVWAVTGSVTLAVLSGSSVLILLSWLVRGWTKHNKVDCLVDEVQGDIDESEFTTLVPGQQTSRDRVQNKVMQESEQVAYSIRAMSRRQVG